MDPNHRDRVAFLKLCSGEFRRGMKLKVQNTGRQISVNAPIMFFASDRELAEDAFAGDVIGIPNHGVLRVGDSLSETGKLRFAGLPNFAPEILRARTGQGSAQGQAPEEGAGEPGGGGGDAAVPARDRRRLHRRRRGPAAVRGHGRPAGRRIRPRRRVRARALSPRPAGSPAPRPISRISPASTARPWPRTSTARRSSSPSPPGRSATSTSASRRSPSNARKSAPEPAGS